MKHVGGHQLALNSVSVGSYFQGCSTQIHGRGKSCSFSFNDLELKCHPSFSQRNWDLWVTVNINTCWPLFESLLGPRDWLLFTLKDDYGFIIHSGCCICFFPWRHFYSTSSCFAWWHKPHSPHPQPHGYSHVFEALGQTQEGHPQSRCQCDNREKVH